MKEAERKRIGKIVVTWISAILLLTALALVMRWLNG
ncbi:hypothetical protein BOTU111922_23280 [Bordetella tumulicola]